MNESSISIHPNRRVCLHFERDFKRRGAALLHQQCGLWGQDVRRENGGMRQNALLELGFERTPPPQGVLGATTYARTEKSGVRVTLWGFGMRFGDENGGIFLSRFAFWPRFSEAESPEWIWAPAQVLETHHAPRRARQCLAALDGFRGALRWIANYEREIEARFGADYRAEALQAWLGAKNQVSTPNLAFSWDEMADRCESRSHFSLRSRGARLHFSRDELQSALADDKK